MLPAWTAKGAALRLGRTIAQAIRAAIIAFAALTAGQAHAAWPDRTITLIVIFPPGGSNDLLGRLIAAELAPALGQNVIVENRAGANGNIGLAAGARAAPDGTTLVVASGVVLINPSVSRVGYDPAKDFAPIAYLGDSPNVILTRPASGIVSMSDLIAKAKAAPGKLTFASPGVGSVSQLAVELLKLRTGIDLIHVPFSGAAPAAQAAIAGTTDLASVSVAGLIGHIQSGTLKALAQTGKERWPDLPDVPTLEQAGIANAVVDDHRSACRGNPHHPAEAGCARKNAQGELRGEVRGARRIARAHCPRSPDVEGIGGARRDRGKVRQVISWTRCNADARLRDRAERAGLIPGPPRIGTVSGSQSGT
jgi:tripartite-type tricarboxylate transporter receptor subunit TctC